MSGERTLLAIPRLLAAVRADREALGRLRDRLDQALPSRPWPGGDPMLYLVAVTLEHYFTGCETLLERIAREFEGPPTPSPRWHQELLETMALDIRGIRPAVLRGETASELRELLAFRHFMRHAYAVELRPARLAELAELLVSVHPKLGQDLDAFTQLLEATDDGSEP